MIGFGVAAALHLNARTDHDYARWTKFVAERPEVTMVAFEFATGAGYSERLEWHVDRLCALATAAGHELTLIVSRRRARDYTSSGQPPPSHFNRD